MIKQVSKRAIEVLAIFVAILVGTASLSAQNRTVRGTVVDEANVPVIGAAVVLVGNNTVGTMTNVDGAFSLNVPANASLEVSCIGYANQVVAVGNQSNIRVVLAADAEFLEETVVIGYGVQKKSDLTGSVASVREDDLKNRSTTDAAAALQGKAAGVQILNASGAPGQGASIRVRGYSSNSANIGPLLIVDGLQVSSIQYLDPSLIESMEVLKDAASAAIYGAQAGNGVVLITTKTGATNNGQSSVTYNGKFTMQSLAKRPEIFNAADYIDYKRASGFDIDSMLKLYNYDGTDTDWISELFGNSLAQQHSITFQGGNNKGHFFTNLSYLNNDGIVKGDKDVYNRLSLQVNADYNIFKWLQVGINNSIEKWSTKSVSQHSAYSSFMMEALTIDPLTPTYYDDPSQFASAVKQNYDAWMAGDPTGYPVLKNENPNDPNYGRYYASSHYFADDNGNPFLQRDRTDSSNGGININGTLFANLTPIKGLTLTSRFGYRISQSSSHSYSTPYYITNQAKDANYNLSGNVNTGLYYQWENFANYVLNIGKHSLTAMAGMSFIENTWDNMNASVSGPDILNIYEPAYRFLDYANSANKGTKNLGNNPGRSASLAYFGRLTYSYDNRYSVQANFRADAFDSSKLAKKSRWGYFPSFSAGWTVSNEAFVKDNISRDILSFLKLRASWGRNGNVSVLNGYPYSTTITTDTWYQYDVEDGTQTFGSRPSGLANPDLKWETSDQIDLGLDARFFTNRLSLGIDWYKKMTNDLLVNVSPVPEVGVGSSTVNAGSIENTGLEFEASWKDSIGDLHYNISGNLATLKNMVTYIEPTVGRQEASEGGVSGTNNPIRTAFEVGYPIWYFRGYKFLGIDEEGNAKIEDIDGNEGITTGDLQYIGKAIPDITYGITISLEYKGFDFNVFGTGVAGNNIFNVFYRADTPLRNSLRYYYDNAWLPGKDNSKATMPDPAKVRGDWGFWGSTASMFKGDFFKIKQLQLGYTLPANLTKKAAISNLRLYVSLDDFFTFSQYPGMDPETATTGSHNGMGFDAGSYPTMKKVVFGVNLTF